MSRTEIEERVLGGLKEKLLSPQLVREFIRAFHEEANRTNAENEQRATADHQQLSSIKRKVAGIVSAIEEGDYSRALRNRLADLEKQQEELEARLSKAPPSTVRLHPRLADVYAQKVGQLEQALNDPAIRTEAAEVLRTLIDRIELRPGEKVQAIAATLYGDLAQILAVCDSPDSKQKLPKAGASGSTVGGCGGLQPPRIDPATHCDSSTYRKRSSLSEEPDIADEERTRRVRHVVRLSTFRPEMRARRQKRPGRSSPPGPFFDILEDGSGLRGFLSNGLLDRLIGTASHADVDLAELRCLSDPSVRISMACSNDCRLLDL